MSEDCMLLPTIQEDFGLGVEKFTWIAGPSANDIVALYNDRGGIVTVDWDHLSDESKQIIQSSSSMYIRITNSEIIHKLLTDKYATMDLILLHHLQRFAEVEEDA